LVPDAFILTSCDVCPCQPERAPAPIVSPGGSAPFGKFAESGRTVGKVTKNGETFRRQYRCLNDGILPLD
jgi:hypothetical protein